MRRRLPLLLFLGLGGVFAAPAAPAERPLVWQEEFAQPAGSTPASARWVFDLGHNQGWGNQELQTYTDSRENAFVADDPAALDGKALVIRAARTPAGSYTSARLKTEGKRAWRYGRIEARLKLPRGRGLWPAFWMLREQRPPDSWPQTGEIDIMEHIGGRPEAVFGTIHGPGYSGAHGRQGETLLPAGRPPGADYHVYAVEWTPGRIEWSLDGQRYFVCTPEEPRHGRPWVFDDGAFFLILNLAVGGSLPGDPAATTPFPQEFRIDYVRVYAPLAPEAIAVPPPASRGDRRG